MIIININGNFKCTEKSYLNKSVNLYYEKLEFEHIFSMHHINM